MEERKNDTIESLGTYTCPVCGHDEPHTHFYRGIFSESVKNFKERVLKVGSTFEYGSEKFKVEDISYNIIKGIVEYTCGTIGTANYRHEWFYITKFGYLMQIGNPI